MADAGEPLLDVLVGFAERLREAELAVGSGDVIAYASALAELDPTDLLDLYWTGRSTLVRRRDDLPGYDEQFRRYFLGESAPGRDRLRLRPRSVTEVEAVLAVAEADPLPGAGDERATLGLQASDVAVLRAKAFSACTADELAALRLIMRRMRLLPPRRRSRRTRPAPRGRTADVRRTVRETLRHFGEPGELHLRARRLRLRPLILILDVSGSMADYSRSLLQFAHSARRASARVEVFCFGTQLTRITRELDRRRADVALERAAAAVSDWDGGTRVGASLDAFVRRWGRRGLARGAIVVVCSDGLDRGDPALLAGAMERLHRQCHRIVWLNPHATRGVMPPAAGMAVAAPWVDLVLPGRDLASLELLARELPALR